MLAPRGHTAHPAQGPCPGSLAPCSPHVLLQSPLAPSSRGAGLVGRGSSLVTTDEHQVPPPRSQAESGQSPGICTHVCGSSHTSERSGHCPAPARGPAAPLALPLGPWTPKGLSSLEGSHAPAHSAVSSSGSRDSPRVTKPLCEQDEWMGVGLGAPPGCFPTPGKPGATV